MARPPWSLRKQYHQFVPLGPVHHCCSRGLSDRLLLRRTGQLQSFAAATEIIWVIRGRHGEVFGRLSRARSYRRRQARLFATRKPEREGPACVDCSITCRAVFWIFIIWHLLGIGIRHSSRERLIPSQLGILGATRALQDERRNRPSEKVDSDQAPQRRCFATAKAQEGTVCQRQRGLSRRPLGSAQISYISCWCSHQVPKDPCSA